MEIKFRGVDREKNCLVYSAEIGLSEFFYLIEDGRIDLETAEQYIGIKDNKRTKKYLGGQEIYAGDIIEFYFSSEPCKKCGHHEKFTDIVRFGALGACVLSWRILDPRANITGIKIIGNVHTHPALLETKVGKKND